MSLTYAYLYPVAPGGPAREAFRRGRAITIIEARQLREVPARNPSDIPHSRPGEGHPLTRPGTECPVLNPSSANGLGRRSAPYQADIACRRLVELSRLVTKRHRAVWLASPSYPRDARQGYDVVVGNVPV
jgi:hypothetical protein